jgi:hypothetical protein
MEIEYLCQLEEASQQFVPHGNFVENTRAITSDRFQSPHSSLHKTQLHLFHLQSVRETFSQFLMFLNTFLKHIAYLLLYELLLKEDNLFFQN